MNMSALRSSVLKKRLENLDSERQLAFGLLCCERLLPNYLVFQQHAGWGNVVHVQKALDSVWSFLYSSAPSPQEIKFLIESCESAAPDSDDFVSLYVTGAQDACFAVCCLLDYMLEVNVDKIVQAATYATDTADLYAQEVEGMAPNDPQLEQKILLHPLMQRELTHQEADLNALELVSKTSREFLEKRKASWNEKAGSPLSRE